MIQVTCPVHAPAITNILEDVHAPFGRTTIHPLEPASDIYFLYLDDFPSVDQLLQTAKRTCILCSFKLRQFYRRVHKENQVVSFTTASTNLVSGTLDGGFVEAAITFFDKNITRHLQKTFQEVHKYGGLYEVDITRITISHILLMHAPDIAPTKIAIALKGRMDLAYFGPRSRPRNSAAWILEDAEYKIGGIIKTEEGEKIAPPYYEGTPLL